MSNVAPTDGINSSTALAPGLVTVLPGSRKQVRKDAAEPNAGCAPVLTGDKRSKNADAVAAGALIKIKQLKKSYRRGRIEVPVLRGVDLEIQRGSVTAVVGQSGSGKSTLLHLMGTLDRPDAGEIWLGEQRIDNLTHTKRDRLRNQQIGMIFQFYHLLPELTALENVLVPRMIRHGVLHYYWNKSYYVRRAKQLLEQVGLGHRLSHRPNQLSGGEMQRTAIARALLAKPTLLLADEPTGNLDRRTGDEILQVLGQLNQQEDITIVMVTHDDSVAQRADRIIRLEEGRVAA